MPFSKPTAPEMAAPTKEAPAIEREVYVEGEPIPKGALEKKEPAHAPEPNAPLAAGAAQPAAHYPAKDQLQKKIEGILEENLGGVYMQLPPLVQQAFKVKGEEVAWMVRGLLAEAKVKIKKIWDIIVEWLKILPGVNRFFVEQEAKIKVDRLLELREGTSL